MEVEPYPADCQESTPALDEEAPQTPTSNIKLLGSQENGLAVIAPHKEDRAVRLLEQLEKVLRKSKAQLCAWIKDEKDDSVRYIQGGRMEIFLNAASKSSAAFDTVIGSRLPMGAKEQILGFAQKQAQQDPRLHEIDDNYKFGNFSLIVSFAVVDCQAPHIDLIKPNWQFGMMISNGAASTLFFESDDHVQSVDALVEHWEKMALASDNPQEKNRMTPALIDSLKQEPAVDMLLKGFGDVLLPARYVLYSMKKENNLPTGSVLSLPGSVVHAAPAAASFRAVIFFSGCSGKSEVAEYNPDTQYTGVMLAGHITSLMWSKPGIGFSERLYLLQRLARYVDWSNTPKMWRHFAPGNLADFVGNIEHNKTSRREEYIAKMAHSPHMISGFTEKMEDDTPNLQDYHLVSVSDLYTLWEDEEFHVEIYRRISDGKIVLCYPSQGEMEADEFEGSKPEENFQLVMKQGWEQELFDGRNGDLLDTEGELVDVYRGRGEDI